MPAASGASTDSAISEFKHLLEQKGRVRLMDVFLTNETIPVTRGDLKKFSGMSQPTVSRRVRDLCEYGIIEESEEGSPRLFRLEMDHPAAEGLLNAYKALHDHIEEIQAASEDFKRDSDLFHAGSPFVELFQYPTNVEILAALLERPDASLKAADISRITDLDKSTVYDNIGVLTRIGIVNEVCPDYTRHIRYELDRSHPATDGFLTMIKGLRAESSAGEVEQFPRDDWEAIKSLRSELVNEAPEEQKATIEPVNDSEEETDSETLKQRFVEMREQASESEGENTSTNREEVSEVKEEEIADLNENLRYQYHQAAHAHQAVSRCAA